MELSKKSSTCLKTRCRVLFVKVILFACACAEHSKRKETRLVERNENKFAPQLFYISLLVILLHINEIPRHKEKNCLRCLAAIKQMCLRLQADLPYERFLLVPFFEALGVLELILGTKSFRCLGLLSWEVEQESLIFSSKSEFDKPDFFMLWKAIFG